MLVLSRRLNEKILIPGMNMSITVVGFKPGQVLALYGRVETSSKAKTAGAMKISGGLKMIQPQVEVLSGPLEPGEEAVPEDFVADSLEMGKIVPIYESAGAGKLTSRWFRRVIHGALAQLTPVRTTSVTGPQALALLNNDSILAHAKALAGLLEGQSDRPRRQVGLACLRVWGRPPTREERAEFVAFVRRHGLANLCRVLFNSNEFLFVD